MNGEEEEKFGLKRPEHGHGRANLGTGSANFLWLPTFFSSKTLARPCQIQHGPCQHSGQRDFKIFHFLDFSRIILGQLPTKQIKTKKNKTKAIKCVGCLPRSALLMSLA
jgi:hypothetical protein